MSDGHQLTSRKRKSKKSGNSGNKDTATLGSESSVIPTLEVNSDVVGSSNSENGGTIVSASPVGSEDDRTLATDIQMTTLVSDDDNSDPISSLIICVGGGEKYQNSPVYNTLNAIYGSVHVVAGLQKAIDVAYETNQKVLYVHGSLITVHDKVEQFVTRAALLLADKYCMAVLMRWGDRCSQLRASSYSDMLEATHDYNNDIGAYVLSPHSGHNIGKGGKALVYNHNVFIAPQNMDDSRFSNMCRNESMDVNTGHMWFWGILFAIILLVVLIIIIALLRRR